MMNLASMYSPYVGVLIAAILLHRCFLWAVADLRTQKAQLTQKLRSTSAALETTRKENALLKHALLGELAPEPHPLPALIGEKDSPFPLLDMSYRLESMPDHTTYVDMKGLIMRAGAGAEEVNMEATPDIIIRRQRGIPAVDYFYWQGVCVGSCTHHDKSQTEKTFSELLNALNGHRERQLLMGLERANRQSLAEARKELRA